MNMRTAYIQVLILLTLCPRINASSSLPACPREESAIPLGTQTPLGLSGNELLTSFFPPQVSFRWRNKPQTTASIRFVPSSDSVRVLTWSRGDGCATPSPSIFIDGVLTIQAADGSANAQCATSIEANLVDGAIEISTTCDALEQLPGPPLSHEFWTDFLLSMNNGQLSGEITRMYLVDEGGGIFRGEDVQLATIGGKLDEASDGAKTASENWVQTFKVVNETTMSIPVQVTTYEDTIMTKTSDVIVPGTNIFESSAGWQNYLRFTMKIGDASVPLAQCRIVAYSLFGEGLQDGDGSAGFQCHMISDSTGTYLEIL